MYGLWPRISNWMQLKLLRPAQEMTSSQLITAIGIGAWGGLFPFPPCTAPAVMTCSTLYSAIMPSMYRFTAPMYGISLATSQIVLPLDICLMPQFIAVGQKGWCWLSGSASHPVEVGDVLLDLKSDIGAAVARFGGCLAAGAAAWAVSTPGVLFITHVCAVRMKAIRFINRKI